MTGDLILVIEANEANSMLAQAVLEREGFRVEIAASAAEAEQSLRSISPDLILMDVNLPGLDGLSLSRRLRDAPSSSDIPIVALTAHAMLGDRELALEAGCDAYIPKPIETRTIAEQLREVIAAAAPRTRGRSLAS